MFAVIRTGGKQYRVAAEDTLKVGRLAGEPGSTVTLGEVLVIGEGENATVGAPLVEGASVVAEVVAQGRHKTVISFKKRRRQNSRRKRGQRQHETTLRITEILAAGQTPSRRQAAEAETAAPVTAATVAAEAAAATDVAAAEEAKPRARTKRVKAADAA
jgi:large subunit ribosomal protein L21